MQKLTSSKILPYVLHSEERSIIIIIIHLGSLLMKMQKIIRTLTASRKILGYNSSWTWTNTLAFNKTFGATLIKFVGGSEAIENYGRAIQGFQKWIFYYQSELILRLIRTCGRLDFGPPAGQTTTNINGTTILHSTLFSLFGRADYGFQDKYLLVLLSEGMDHPYSIRITDIAYFLL